MKKILAILIFSLLTSSNLFAENFNQFNKWLLKNGHSQYLKDGGAQVDICATFKKNSDAWLNEECGNYPKGKMITMNNLNIKLANKALSSTNITYHATQIAYYDEIRIAKSCKKLKLEDLGYSCEEIENQN